MVFNFTKTDIIKLIKGTIFCGFWYGSICAGFITLYCPILPLLAISNYCFRNITDKIFAFWELYPTAMLQLLFGTKIVVYGAPVDPNECSILVMNHRTRVDWNYLWLGMHHAVKNRYQEKISSFKNTKKKQHIYDRIEHISKSNSWEDLGSSDVSPTSDSYLETNLDDATNTETLKSKNKKNKIKNNIPNGNHCVTNGGKLVKSRNNDNALTSLADAFLRQHRLKYVLKDEIKYAPGSGWVMQLCCFLYIRRNWDRDQSQLSNITRYLERLKYKCQILIFPEGTDLTNVSMLRSNRYAEKNQLQNYQYVLHPKTTGFCYLASEMMRTGQLDCIYDISIGYPDFLPQNEGQILLGNFPKEVHFHFVRYSVADLPQSEDKLRDWLNARWKEKEKKLEDFYKRGTFKNKSDIYQNTSKLCLYCALVFWTLLSLSVPLLLLFSTTFQAWTIAHVVLFTIISIFTNGFQEVEIGIFNLKYGCPN